MFMDLGEGVNNDLQKDDGCPERGDNGVGCGRWEWCWP